MTYVYVLKDKATGLTEARVSRFGGDFEGKDTMFRASVSDVVAAERLIKDMNLEMMSFGDCDANRVDRVVYIDAMMDIKRKNEELLVLRNQIDEQAAIKRSQNAEIHSLKEEISTSRNYIASLETFVHNVKNALALIVALSQTHREKNGALRYIIKSIQERDWLVNDSLDDIPF